MEKGEDLVGRWKDKGRVMVRVSLCGRWGSLCKCYSLK